MKEYLKIANDPMMWVMCIPTVIMVAIQATVFTKKAFKTVDVKAVNLTRNDCWIAFKAGAISAIGPAMAVFIVMLGMMAVVGGPITWLRLSIIGAAPTELTASTMGAKAMGVEFGSPEYDITAYAASVWTMTLNGCGWLLVGGLFTHKLDKVKTKVSGGDTKLMGEIGGAALLGSLSYLVGGHVVAGGARLIAAVVSGAFMLLLMKLAKKHSWLTEYNLGIAMVAGMFIAVMFAK